MEPCRGDPAGRYRTDSRLLVAGAPGARMRALQWRAGTTLSIRTPPLTGPPKVPDGPPISLSLSILSFFPRSSFKLALISNHQSLRENSSQKTFPRPAIFMLMIPRPTSLAEVVFIWASDTHDHLDVPEAQNFPHQNQTPLSSLTCSFLSLLYLNERHLHQLLSC